MKTKNLHNQLVERQENGLVRSLISVNHLIDFCSNDYLGLAKNPSLADKIDADFKALKEYAKLVPIPEWKNRDNRNCIERFTNVNPYPADDTLHAIWFHCQAYLHAVSSTNPQIIGDILLSWASASKDPMFVVPFEHPAHTTAGYNIPSNIGTFAQFYAFWYDEIEYTPDERKRVDAYMTKKLIEQKFPVTLYGRRPCDINNINSVLQFDLM